MRVENNLEDMRNLYAWQETPPVGSGRLMAGSSFHFVSATLKLEDLIDVKLHSGQASKVGWPSIGQSMQMANAFLPSATAAVLV